MRRAVSPGRMGHAMRARGIGAMTIARLGLPVLDIYSLITWLHAGRRPRDFAPLAHNG